jgi:hypothetical protein
VHSRLRVSRASRLNRPLRAMTPPGPSTERRSAPARAPAMAFPRRLGRRWWMGYATSAMGPSPRGRHSHGVRHDARDLSHRPSTGPSALALASGAARAQRNARRSARASTHQHPFKSGRGAYSRGKNRQARYQSAAASAREALACLETAEALGWVQPLETELGALFHRVIGTLVRLIEPRR